MEIKPIAYIKCDFKNKFGLPRQSGRVPSLCGTIIFEPEYRVADALKGLEGFDYLWLIFDFSLSHREKWSPMVRPPRLGGNEKKGVFATRSPFRPNSLGLSSVKLDKIEKTDKYGLTLKVSGIDLIDGTPIFDIKPYISFSDSHENARSGFADSYKNYKLNVNFPQNLLLKVDENKRASLIDCLSEDPRPSYIKNDNKIYKMKFANLDIKFKVKENILTILDIEY